MADNISPLSCQYGEDEFQYEIIYLPERKHKIAIHVHPNGVVQVDAPEGAKQADIKRAVNQRARWVTRHLADIRQRQKEVLPRRYVSGESCFYLGRRYLLKVKHIADGKPETKLVAGRLNVNTRDTSPEAIKQLLWHWYKTHARTNFQKRLYVLAEKIPRVRKYPPEIRLLTMKRQWGSCSPGGTIILNPHLIKAPRDCIDYVILHELCHLQEHNHSPKFYQLLTRYQPEWKSIKAKLDNLSEILLNQ